MYVTCHLHNYVNVEPYQVVNAKGFYLLQYSIARRTISLSPLHMCNSYVLCFLTVFHPMFDMYVCMFNETVSHVYKQILIYVFTVMKNEPFI